MYHDFNAKSMSRPSFVFHKTLERCPMQRANVCVFVACSILIISSNHWPSPARLLLPKSERHLVRHEILGDDRRASCSIWNNRRRDSSPRIYVNWLYETIGGRATDCVSECVCFRTSIHRKHDSMMTGPIEIEIRGASNCRLHWSSFPLFAEFVLPNGEWIPIITILHQMHEDSKASRSWRVVRQAIKQASKQATNYSKNWLKSCPDKPSYCKNFNILRPIDVQILISREAWVRVAWYKTATTTTATGDFLSRSLARSSMDWRLN